ARRWRELALWVTGGMAFAVYYAFHATRVVAAVQPGDFAHAHSYIRLLGLPFIFMTVYAGWLTLLPPAASPFATALGMTSLWAPAAPAHVTISLLVYFALFCVAGQPFNFYWGYLTSAIWGHALVHSAAGLWTLLR